MPIYKCKIWYTTHVTREIEAKDAEEAEYKVIQEGVSQTLATQAIENLDAMEFNNLQCCR